MIFWGNECSILSSVSRLVFLTSTLFDTDEKTFILAKKLVSQEDRINWLGFLKRIAPYLTYLQDSKVVIIGDSPKDLASAVAECFSPAINSYGSKYLYDALRQI